MNWTKIVLKSVKDVFDAVNPILGTEEANEALGINQKGERTYGIDKVAENAYLNNLPEGVAVISEESEPKSGGNAVVFLDPICASVLARRGSKYFSTAIAVYSGQLAPICEAIGNFETGDIYHADKNGAFKNGRQITVSDKKKLDDSVIVNFESHMISNRLGIINTELFRKVPHAFCPGSVKTSLALLSEGIIDGYVSAGKDYPSAELIGVFLVKKAGGIVSDIKGNPIKIYPDMKHTTSLLCSCTRELHESLLKML
jgi:myo-inositol-1(or 4)-monophosphatase